MSLAQRPDDNECFDFHRDYVAGVPDGDIMETLVVQAAAVKDFIGQISEHQAGLVHEPYTWTIRQVIEHCCDAERVFGYRLLRFAAGDTTDLPGWDEVLYAESGYGPRSEIAELNAEFGNLRAANLALLRRLSPDCWVRKGRADGRVMSVRTVAWLMAGHWIHHEKILRKRLDC